MLKDEESAALRREIDRLKSDAASSGFPSMPGYTQAQIAELFIRYFSNLPGLIIQEMRHVLLKAKAQPSQELSRYLKDMISLSCAISPNGLQNYLKLEGIDSEIAEAGTALISSPGILFPEIDLIMYELENIERGDVMKSKSHTATYNINAPGGIVQTGDQSIANLLKINQNHKDDIVTALNNLEIAVNNLAELQNNSREEVIDLIKESVSEVSKTQPNKTRLKSFLNGITSTIQTCASLKPAYDALKTVLLPIGINLP